MLGLLEPGDEVVVFEPFYDSYAATIAMAGGERRLVSRCARRTSRSTSTRCAAAVGPRARMLLLNSPHNPTGRVLSRAELEAVARVCVEHDLIAVDRRGLRAPRLRRRARPAGDAAGDGRAHADDLQRGQVVLVHGLEDRLVQRAAGARRRPCARRSSSSRSPAARRCSTRSRRALADAERYARRCATTLQRRARPRCARACEAAGLDVRPRPAGTLLRQRRRRAARRADARVVPRAARARGRRRDPDERASTTTPRPAARSCASRSASATGDRRGRRAARANLS